MKKDVSKGEGSDELTSLSALPFAISFLAVFAFGVVLLSPSSAMGILVLAPALVPCRYLLWRGQVSVADVASVAQA